MTRSSLRLIAVNGSLVGEPPPLTPKPIPAPPNPSHFWFSVAIVLAGAVIGLLLRGAP